MKVNTFNLGHLVKHCRGTSVMYQSMTKATDVRGTYSTAMLLSTPTLHFGERKLKHTGLGGKKVHKCIWTKRGQCKLC